MSNERNTEKYVRSLQQQLQQYSRNLNPTHHAKLFTTGNMRNYLHTSHDAGPIREKIIASSPFDSLCLPDLNKTLDEEKINPKDNQVTKVKEQISQRKRKNKSSGGTMLRSSYQGV